MGCLPRSYPRSDAHLEEHQSQVLARFCFTLWHLKWYSRCFVSSQDLLGWPILGAFDHRRGTHCEIHFSTPSSRDTYWRSIEWAKRACRSWGCSSCRLGCSRRQEFLAPCWSAYDTCATRDASRPAILWGVLPIHAARARPESRPFRPSNHDQAAPSCRFHPMSWAFADTKACFILLRSWVGSHKS